MIIIIIMVIIIIIIIIQYRTWGLFDFSYFLQVSDVKLPMNLYYILL